MSGRVVRKCAEDAGSAVVEFCVIAVVALMPLVFGAAALLQLHRIDHAVAAAAGEAARAFSTASSDEQAGRRAHAAAILGLRAAGVPPDAAQVQWRCSARPCLTPGSRIRMTVTAAPALVPGMPAGVPRSWRFSGHATAVIDSFRDAA